MNKILFFSHLRDTVGKDSVEMNTAGKTVVELKQLLSETLNLQKLDTVMIAINEEFATDDEIIKDGDTIALIPPVSGG